MGGEQNVDHSSRAPHPTDNGQLVTDDCRVVSQFEMLRLSFRRGAGRTVSTALAMAHIGACLHGSGGEKLMALALRIVRCGPGTHDTSGPEADDARPSTIATLHIGK